MRTWFLTTGSLYNLGNSSYGLPITKSILWIYFVSILKNIAIFPFKNSNIERSQFWFYFGEVLPKAGLSIASLHCALSRS
ncbi:hypothetical protein EXE23_14590 [Acinetobacter venetianus]|nr:hypothetical protein EXE23_14590 [Acinetobacter venetianus]